MAALGASSAATAPRFISSSCARSGRNRKQPPCRYGRRRHCHQHHRLKRPQQPDLAAAARAACRHPPPMSAGVGAASPSHAGGLPLPGTGRVPPPPGPPPRRPAAEEGSHRWRRSPVQGRVRRQWRSRRRLLAASVYGCRFPQPRCLSHQFLLLASRQGHASLKGGRGSLFLTPRWRELR